MAAMSNAREKLCLSITGSCGSISEERWEGGGGGGGGVEGLWPLWREGP